MTRNIGTPEPGFYKRRLAKGGPWVAVLFYQDADGALRCAVDGDTHRDGELIDPHEEWPLCWPSSESDHRFFAVMREWARCHAPYHPAARPRQRIDLGSLPPRTRP